MTGRSIIDSLWGPAREQGHAAGSIWPGSKRRLRQTCTIQCDAAGGITTTIIGNVGRGRDSDLVGIARGDSESWRQLPNAMVAQTGFEVNRLRLLVGEKTLLGAIIMGDQKLSFPLEKIISQNVDISPIRERLLAPNARVGDMIAEFWADMKNTFSILNFFAAFPLSQDKVS